MGDGVRNRPRLSSARLRLYFSGEARSEQMSVETIYAKTQKGFEEMTRRTYRLPARMRALLIMIDGRLLAGELFAREQHPEESQQLIESLLKDGFIEPIGGIAAPPDPSTARTEPAVMAASAPSRSHSTIPAGWAPDQAVLDQLAGLGIDRGYALDAVPEFVRYWTDAGSAAASWHAKYLRHIQRQWARDRQRHQVGRRGGGAPAGFIEKHTDPTWRNGL